jgi:hypothetical protein
MANQPADAPDVGASARHIEDAQKNHKNIVKALHDELNAIRTGDTHDGKLDNAAFHDHLQQLQRQLHTDAESMHLKGLLPRIELVDSKSVDVKIRAISGDGDVHDGDNGQLVTRAHGREFKYDKDGHLTQWSENHGKDVWKVGEDGKYYQYENGKKTGKSTDDICEVDDKGNFVRTHKDGSSTTYTRGGLTIDRDSQDRITEIQCKGFSREFHYGADGLDRVTTHQDGKPDQTFEKPGDHFYATDDKDHKHPFDISVGTEHGHNGAVLFKDVNAGTSREEFPHGAQIDRKTVTVNGEQIEQIQHIRYSNGNEADFKYADDGKTVTGYSVTGKDGKTHNYTVDGDKVMLDGKELGTGSISLDDAGHLSIEGKFKLPDGTEAAKLSFDRSGSILTTDQDGHTVEVTNCAGHVNKFKWQDGKLTEVDAYGYHLKLKGDKWVDADGNESSVTPSIDEKGNFTLTDKDGYFTSWARSGNREQGEPETKAGEEGGKHDGWVDARDENADAINHTDKVVQSNGFQIEGPPTISEQEFEKVLKDNNSPAAGDAQEIYNYAVSKNIDPAVALAFFQVESGFGTAGAAVPNKNWGNLRPHDWSNRPIGESEGFSTYATWADGAKDYIDLMATHYAGRSLGDAIVEYAPPGDGNDPAAYVASVENYVTGYRRDDRWA